MFGKFMGDVHKHDFKTHLGVLRSLVSHLLYDAVLDALGEGNIFIGVGDWFHNAMYARFAHVPPQELISALEVVDPERFPGMLTRLQERRALTKVAAEAFVCTAVRNLFVTNGLLHL